MRTSTFRWDALHWACHLHRCPRNGYGSSSCLWWIHLGWLPLTHTTRSPWHRRWTYQNRTFLLLAKIPDLWYPSWGRCRTLAILRIHCIYRTVSSPFSSIGTQSCLHYRTRGISTVRTLWFTRESRIPQRLERACTRFLLVYHLSSE